MDGSGFIILLLIGANLYFSYRGFRDSGFFHRHCFHIERIIQQTEYRRMLTSGFLHVNWMHLIFNMIALYIFSDSLGAYLGVVHLLLIYFAGLLGGSIFSLFVHRNHPGYTSAGASGAVAAVIFSSIALFPGMQIGFILIPLSIPAWIFGLLYMLYSIYGVRSRHDNIGHDSHLAGALTGMLLAAILVPSSIRENPLPFILIALPALFFIFMIIRKPHALFIDNFFYKEQKRFHSVDHRYNAERASRQQQIDHILEKIHRSGIKSLSKKEKEILREYSQKVE